MGKGKGGSGGLPYASGEPWDSPKDGNREEASADSGSWGSPTDGAGDESSFERKGWDSAAESGEPPGDWGGVAAEGPPESATMAEPPEASAKMAEPPMDDVVAFGERPPESSAKMSEPPMEEVVALGVEPPPPDIVNLGFAPNFHADKLLSPNESLAPSSEYFLWLQVGHHMTQSAGGGVSLGVEKLPKEARLQVALFSFEDELEITPGEDVGELQIQRERSESFPPAGQELSRNFPLR